MREWHWGVEILFGVPECTGADVFVMFLYSVGESDIAQSALQNLTSRYSLGVWIHS